MVFTWYCNDEHLRNAVVSSIIEKNKETSTICNARLDNEIENVPLSQKPKFKIVVHNAITKPTSFDVFENQTTPAYRRQEARLPRIHNIIQMYMDSPQSSFASYGMANECHYKFSLVICIMAVHCNAQQNLYFCDILTKLTYGGMNIESGQCKRMCMLMLEWNAMEFECLVSRSEFPR